LVVSRIVLMSVSRENSLRRQGRYTLYRGLSTAVDLRVSTRRSILAQQDRAL